MFCSSTTFIKTIKGRRRRGERGGQRLRRVEEKNSWICRESNGVYGKEKRKRKRKDKLIIFCDLYFEVPQFNLFVVKRFCWLIRKQLFGSYVFPFFLSVLLSTIFSLISWILNQSKKGRSFLSQWSATCLAASSLHFVPSTLRKNWLTSLWSWWRQIKPYLRSFFFVLKK